MLEIPKPLLDQLLEHLRRQGSAVRESGAFLLGTTNDVHRLAVTFLPYEALQADALNEDFVVLSAESFSKLWAECGRLNYSVVADVHTHRFGPQQSPSDRANPMMALAGHMALIVPRFAQGRVEAVDIGVHVYRGAHRWTSYFGQDVHRVLRIGG
jgi:proteasome lid subunit RPN8/RPN11